MPEAKTPLIGLHQAVYIEKEFLADAIKAADKLLYVCKAGIDTPTALEKLGLLVLNSNGHFPARI